MLIARFVPALARSVTGAVLALGLLPIDILQTRALAPRIALAMPGVILQRCRGRLLLGADLVLVLGTCRPAIAALRWRWRLTPSRGCGRGTNLWVGVDVHHPGFDQLRASGRPRTSHVDGSADVDRLARERVGAADSRRFLDRRDGICGQGLLVSGGRSRTWTWRVLWCGLVCWSRTVEQLVDGSLCVQSFRECPRHLRRICARREPANGGGIRRCLGRPGRSVGRIGARCSRLLGIACWRSAGDD
jgi:hypothetical protein